MAFMDMFDTKTPSGKLAIGILGAILLICLICTILSFVTGASTTIVTPTLAYVSGSLYLISTLLLLAFVIYVIVKATTSKSTTTGVALERAMQAETM